MLILPCLAVLYLPTLHHQGLQTRTMHYTGTSRILFHIHIGVISKAITEHDPDLCYMAVFTFLSSQPRYNSRQSWQPFSACFPWQGICHISQVSFINLFLPLPMNRRQCWLILVQSIRIPIAFDNLGS